MTNGVLETLFLPYQNGELEFSEEASGIFFNAQHHAALSNFPAMLLQQHFKPYANILQDEGFRVSSLPPETSNAYTYAFVLLPKNVQEASYLLACACQALKNGGTLIAAADNKAGGNRIQKLFENFEFPNIQSESKNRARVVWANKQNLDQDAIENALKSGDVQNILENAYQSQPGIFGWDKIDAGSKILLEHLDQPLEDTGADFGCGYGYLTCEVLKNNDKISALSCIDADYRAIRLCQMNIEKTAPAQTTLRYFWEDLTNPVMSLSDLDWVIMNPPFHEGKTTDSSIGVNFILTAHKALRMNGALWMVANTHLPYETVLEKNFSNVKKIYEGSGFKVFKAVK